MIIVCGQQNIPLRGHRDFGKIDVSGCGRSQSAANDGNFRSLLRLMISCGDETLKSHMASAPKNAMYTSPLVQNQLIQIIGELIQERILKQIDTGGGLFAVLADETQDLSSVEQLSVCIRYLYKGKIHEEFLLFEDLHQLSFVLDFNSLGEGEVLEPKLSGELLGKAILESLDKVGLDIQKCVEQGYDGAPVMSSSAAGAASVLLTKNPRALYTHCASHSLNLCIVDACKVQAIRNMISTLRQVIRFVNASAKRKALFKAAVHHCFPTRQQQHLKTFCETRWVERHECMETFLELLPAINLTLEQVILNLE